MFISEAVCQVFKIILRLMYPTFICSVYFYEIYAKREKHIGLEDLYLIKPIQMS